MPQRDGNLMNRISLSIVLALLYLGLSKSFAPAERSTLYLVNEKVFASFFSQAPISVILTNRLRTGFLIKTYFLELRIVQGFKLPETILVRTSYNFWHANKNNIGLSIFNRNDKDGSYSTTPLPPGSIFLGNSSYGRWKLTSLGIRQWYFYSAYKHFPQYLGWGNYRPTQKFWKALKIHQNQQEAYYGDKNQFGTNGSITSKVFADRISRKTENHVNFKDHFRKFFHIPRISSAKVNDE